MESSQDIECPKCGADMILRMARRGKNAGNYFYGCANYPKCKHIINIDSSGQDGEIGDSGANPGNNVGYNRYGATDQNIQIPSFLRARERFRGYQVRFYETMAVPQELLGHISSEEIDRKELKHMNQWRLDYPTMGSDVFIERKLRQSMQVIYKILTRGHITLLSPCLGY